MMGKGRNNLKAGENPSPITIPALRGGPLLRRVLTCKQPLLLNVRVPQPPLRRVEHGSARQRRRRVDTRQGRRWLAGNWLL